MGKADLVGIALGEAFSQEELGGLGQAFGPIRTTIVLAQRIVDAVQMVRFHSGETYQESRIATVFADAMLGDACWRVVEVLRQAGHRWEKRRRGWGRAGDKVSGDFRPWERRRQQRDSSLRG